MPERVSGVRGVHLQQVCEGGVQVAARANLRMTMQLVKDFIIAAAAAYCFDSFVNQDNCSELV